MRKSTAIRLLRFQIEQIKDEKINREEWLLSTSSVILRIFPLSAKYKVGQLEQIRQDPDYFEELTVLNRVKTRKLKAESYLNNFIEEIELLGMESKGNNLEMLFGSFRFWVILLGICGLSFIVGNTAGSPDLKSLQQLQKQEYRELENQLYLQRKKIDSLKNEIKVLRSVG